MKKIIIIFGCACLLLFFLIIESDYFQNSEENETDATEEFEVIEWLVGEELTEDLEIEEPDHEENLLTDEEVFIGLAGDEIEERFGEPDRIDPTAYSYDWWIYLFEEDSTTYLQVGIQDDEVVTAFVSGQVGETFFSVGEMYEELDDLFTFSNQVDVKASNGQYQFELSAADLLARPLVEVDGEWVQLYFDTHTNELSSLRMLTADMLVEMRPYSVSYIGDPPERPTVSNDDWQEIEHAEARQIFDYTNVIRARHGLEAYEWQEDVAVVAYGHSREMKEKEFFSHTSPEYGELDQRFERSDIGFRLAGENIAAMYTDGVAAVEGWLNSEGHRVNLLHEEFTHLGVGVFQDYYTQNFMTPWSF
ncbi:CAP domain-containing protein [Halalkalibacter sp. APA_J-10(15)]|uniref:CAP domain-containing protein n=1 Tax=Halalkalibacter sp. APA_J-10(15) TaxID=2933805 RepID=UPI001FF69880|nr:CAP domain-containing protein [Halalkalibacter sp. APA_J-10(15)]MCK0470633.1 CAP domain-containing protein [Halalkalibacter sp. APA_J-10(15)]